MIDSSKLASYLASRIFHDLVSPLTALMNGCSLAFDDDMGMSMRAEGEKLIKEGVQGIEAKIQFMRFAVGSQALTDDLADIHAAKLLFDRGHQSSDARSDEHDACYDGACRSQRRGDGFCASGGGGLLSGGIRRRLARGTKT